MSIIGRIVGTLIGAAFGPLGLIAGFVFGNLFDKAISGESGQTIYTPFGRKADSLDQRQSMSFVAIFSLLGKVAAADGSISQASRRSLDRLIDHTLQLDSVSASYARRLFEQAGASSATAEAIARQYYQTFQDDYSLLETTMNMIMSVAMSDGNLSSREEQVIASIARVFGFSQQDLDRLKARYGINTSSISKAYATLGLSESASDEDVKKAYRKLSLEYHPDAVASKGLSAEFAKFATEKFKDIQEAYDSIKKQRGIR